MGDARLTPPPLLRPLAHFVGRGVALAQMAQWWTAARQGTRQVGGIAGDAGIDSFRLR
jgi:hypothetical protein